jgi:cell filamentation protein
VYDAVGDPYTYENSTILINKLDLRDQSELDDFEAEISSARANEPLPEGDLDFAHYCAVHRHLTAGMRIRPKQICRLILFLHCEFYK